MVLLFRRCLTFIGTLIVLYAKCHNVHGYSVQMDYFGVINTKFNDFVDAMDPVKSIFKAVAYKIGFGEQCPFADSPSASVRKLLKERLQGQDRAIEAVSLAVEAWEFSLSSREHRTPLVLAITGPTGTGKTETSNLIAEGLFKYKRRLSNSDKEVSSGLLVFRGEDFSDNFTNPVTQYHEQIKQRLAEHLLTCSGKAVVVFDEVQKVIPQTLDVLMESMSNRPQLTYYQNGVTRTIDCSNVIFILVSDIGSEAMIKLLLEHDSREDVPHFKLVTAVKDALDEQWKRLQFSKMVNKVIPFLPLEPTHIKEIIKSKLEDIAKTFAGKYWRSLRATEQVAEHLARASSVKYQNHKVPHGKRKIFAKYGARNVENSGPLQQLKAKLFRHLRPWNRDADILIKIEDSDIVIDSIQAVESSSDGDSVSTEGEGVCTTKWRGKLE